MTDAEQQIEMGRAVSELAALRTQRACLKTRVDGYLKLLDTTRDRLQSTKQLDRMIEHALDQFIALSLDPANLPLPTQTEITETITALQKTYQRIFELEGRLREWGAID